ncbi:MULTISPECIES: hypothetical protein [Micromonospora]|uniref:Uncharacterized protein n=1 Tax=Micromonospora carbonacea TaxID=47853 RepID=A0A1C4ZYL4_9ACTN|nr:MULTISPECIES: hypothetical protein [Micromonospora]MBB5826654.1 hypothetical protein [Micromonospora carbonacea]MDG4819396.1 hypothetical protein [Micromonospora sp. WMMD956]QLD26145.1 hypothetical protein HXZ27_19630 [Micromonospora carbonacea]SCF38019.1 hypothetical protein GA0070563_110174 [Micromonospora carbonacea]
MVAAGQGLSTDEVQSIREALAAGRKPRVVFTSSAGQIAGQVGQVVELTDPAVSDEFVVVRFGRDELPFSPADVAVAPRGAGRKAAVVAAEAQPEPDPEPVAVEPEFVLDTPRVPAQRREEPRVEQQEQELAEAKPARRPVKAAKVVKPKGPAGLTVTLAYAEGEWTVAAQQGAKALAKPYVVKPAEALRMVALVDVPGVQEAVEQILAAERAEAEQQAEKLRAELAEIEARLAELREAG